MSVAGHVAFVTGAAQGIGLAIASRLAKEGVAVGLCDISDQGVAEAASALRQKGHNAVASNCDVTDLAAVERSFALVETALGSVDILINNAGWSPNKPFLETTSEDCDAIIAVNFVGTLNCSRVALPGMLQRERGRIVCIASDAARAGMPGEAVYAGAKSAVIGFAKSLAAEVARNHVTVNVVSPSSTMTPLLLSMLEPGQLERRVKANPMGRLGHPDDVAEAVLFFATEGAAYVTGQVLSVNGGSLRFG